MGFNNPDVPWSRLEAVLSSRTGSPAGSLAGPADQPLVADPLAVTGDGGDSPAWSRKRGRYEAPELVRGTSAVAYVELHCHSNFSFLDGASHPEELVEEAYRLGLSGLAMTDHDGLYGVVRFAEAGRELELATVFGAELSLGLPGPQNGVPDPAGRHLLVLARGAEGYARLSRVISLAQLAGGEKGRPVYDLDEVAATLREHVLVLTGCRKGHVPAALLDAGGGGMDAAAGELDRLVALFGHDSVAVELTHLAYPDDDERNDALAALAARFGLATVATGNVHYHRPGRRRLAQALAAARARRSLDEMDGWLAAPGTAYLRSGDEMADRLSAYPGAVTHAARLGAELAFDLDLIAPQLPPCHVGAGHTEMSRLRHLTEQGALARYGSREQNPAAYRQLDHELDTIDKLGFPGYFLIVYDIVEFCRRQNIYCQGRGSAANSAVCYALGITNVDAVKWGLLFERFLAPERDGPPDIDVDIESGRREEAIQHVYTKYGRHHAAQVANVISYRPRSAVRDIAKAFGYSPGQQDAWSKQIDRWHSANVAEVGDLPAQVVEYANLLQTFPRHLGIHSGGMVICDRPVIEVCPVEWARMDNRSVLQWDKDDCAAVGLVKFDLLGQGMLSALHYAFDMIHSELDLAHMPLDDPDVYEMLCRADSVGVFQVESRAQMATLPRLQPRYFYDLIVEVALIRPGPIQGGSVHPYIRRKRGREPVTYPHPLMRPALEKTLGVPLFQEQLMQLAIDVAGFDPADADQLRRAMGSKRSLARMAKLSTRFYAGMAHAVSPATRRRPLPQTVRVRQLRLPRIPRHELRLPRLRVRLAQALPPGRVLRRPAQRPTHGLLHAPIAGRRRSPPRRHACSARTSTPPQRHGHPHIDPDTRPHAEPGEPPSRWGRGGPVVRLGLSSVRSLGDDIAQRIEHQRQEGGPYRDIVDLARRTRLTTTHLEALATADAFASLGLTRRQALWAAGAAAHEHDNRLPGTTTGTQAPALPGMDPVDELVADVWATGLSPNTHPVAFARPHLTRLGAHPIARLGDVPDKTRVLVGGIVTHRQRPATARGVTFINLEDETGMLNVTCSPGLWQRYRKTACTSPALLVRGVLEKADGVTNLNADRLTPLTVPIRSASRDFR